MAQDKAAMLKELSMKQELGDMVTRLELHRNNLRDGLQKLEADYAARQTETTKRLADLGAKVVAAEQDCTRLKEKRDRFLAEVNELVAQRQEARKAVEASVSELTGSRQALAECQAKVCQLEGLTQGLGPLEAQCRKVEENLETRKGEFAEVERQLEQVEREAELLHHNAAEMRERAKTEVKSAERRVADGRVWEEAVRIDLEDRTMGLGMREADVGLREARVREEGLEIERREEEVSEKWQRMERLTEELRTREHDVVQDEARFYDVEREQKLEADRLHAVANRVSELDASVSLREDAVGQREARLHQGEVELEIKTQKLNEAGRKFTERQRQLNDLIRRNKLAIEASEIVL